jgi:hypothetical protein
MTKTPNTSLIHTELLLFAPGSRNESEALARLRAEATKDIHAKLAPVSIAARGAVRTIDQYELGLTGWSAVDDALSWWMLTRSACLRDRQAHGGAKGTPAKDKQIVKEILKKYDELAPVKRKKDIVGMIHQHLKSRRPAYRASKPTIYKYLRSHRRPL